MNSNFVSKAQLISARKLPGEILDEDLRLGMESAFGADFSKVRIHEGCLVPAVGALAFTYGNEIHVAPGLYEPRTPRGRHLIAHELVHVLQQRAGKVDLSAHDDVEIVNERVLEAEALQAGLLACRPGTRNLTAGMPVSACGGRCIQKIDEIPAWDNRTVRGSTNYVLVSNTALLTHNNMTGGSGPSNSINPAGFVSGDCPHHHQRGHLIGNKLGGSGQTINNLVTLTEGTNHPFMYEYEEAIYLHVKNRIGDTFVYQVEAFYDESQYTNVEKPIPAGASPGSTFGAAGNPYCDFPCPSHILITLKDSIKNDYPTAHRIPLGSKVGNAAKILNGIYKFHQISTRHIAGKCWAVTD